MLPVRVFLHGRRSLEAIKDDSDRTIRSYSQGIYQLPSVDLTLYVDNTNSDSSRMKHLKEQSLLFKQLSDTPYAMLYLSPKSCLLSAKSTI